MCGINGIFYFNSSLSEDPVRFENENFPFIENMNSEIAHRGPDGIGSFIKFPVCFGHRRLSIIDLSREADQPMFNEDRSIVLIYNGEIYNYPELMSELKNKGHVFKTKSDTEVILRSYQEYGTGCVSKFNGMWSFALYDFKKKIFFASRDRFGVKPFYYFIDKDKLIFSSEIKAILKIKKITDSYHPKVFEYLAYGYKTSNGDTFFNEVKELKASHNFIIENGKNEIIKYWDLNNKEELNFNYKNIAEETEALIKNSVKIRFRSDVPVSILLSGGLDSGIITKITDELIESHELNNKNVSAYSAVFPGFRYDESKQIKDLLQTCSHINSVFLNPDQQNLIESIDDFVYAMGEPVFSTTSFAHFLLMKEIKKNNIKVVLNGQGADEAWCGYGKYLIGYFLLDQIFSDPGKLFSQMNSISDKMKFSYIYILKQTLKSIISRKSASFLRSEYQEKVMGALSENLKKANSSYFENSSYNKFSSGNLSGYLKYNIEYQGFNQILHYEDHSAMSSSVEMRSPFIDYRIMELAFSIPSKYKFDHGITKKILREIYKTRLPKSITGNNNKIGFLTPFDNWMEQNSLSEFINDILNSQSFNSKNIWNASKIRNIFKNRDQYPDFPYWRIINLELWSKAYGINNL
ncbi:MAG TPA: asparagine synthase (glutamine-hydrolyzing) [Ignavibacteria bacterium]|nr:asparagine synthase (glutamine-hydrolyzing) [Ignavibacteria bacterium]